MALALAYHRAALFGAALAYLAAPAIASANGRYPAAGQIALDPASGSTILVRATYGLLLTGDHGKDWSWICEDAVGFGGSEDPMLAFAADGSILAGTFEGLAVSEDTGCDWGFVGGGLAGLYVIDLAMEKGDPSKGVALIMNASGLVQLWETGNDGAMWTQAGASLPASFVGLTVETAPSDRNRVYASGYLGPPGYPGGIERSDDRGATWQPLLIPGSDQATLPYISGIDPQDPDVLYVRLDGSPTDQLVVSRDGGMTWTKVFETKTPVMGATASLLGFALSPDGSTVAVGGPMDGLWTAPTTTLAFSQVSTMSALCLTWAPEGLYGCGDELADGFTAGISTDQGTTWTPLLHRAGLCGPLACGASSSVTRLCTDLWPLVAPGLGAPGCSGASSSSASSGTGGGGGGGGQHGCGCALAGATTAGLTSAAGALLAAFGLAARRRRRTPGRLGSRPLLHALAVRAFGQIGRICRKYRT